MFFDQANTLHKALRDLLKFYDKMEGHGRELGVGWDWKDIKRIQEIRKLI